MPRNWLGILTNHIYRPESCATIRSAFCLILYDLKNELKLFFGDDNEENIFMPDILNHKYYDKNDFSYNFKQNDCIFISINVCSLMSKHGELTSFVLDLVKNCVNVAIIAVQEIWNIQYPELVNIPGYEFVFKSREKAQGGGVAFYVKHGIPFKIMKNLSNFVEREFECLTLETTINKKKIILSNIYRPPNPPSGVSSSDFMDSFIDNIDTHLHNLSLFEHDTYVFLDANINLLKINNCQNATRYLETIYSNGFLQKIGKATRIHGEQYSLIDHIMYKTCIECKSGTILTDFSDHFTNFIAIPLKQVKSANEFRFSRNFSINNMQKFKDTLSNLRWQNVLNCKEVNKSFECFWNDFHALFELHFPLKKTKLNRNIHKIHNYMTKGLLISRNNKLTLHKKALANPNLFYNSYKLYRNVFNRIIRANKQMYLDDNFKEYQKNQKKLGIF